MPVQLGLQAAGTAGRDCGMGRGAVGVALPPASAGLTSLPECKGHGQAPPLAACELPLSLPRAQWPWGHANERNEDVS